jgi:hypothetical protein
MDDKLPVTTNNNPNPLWEEILKFSRNKFVLAVLLVIVGILGFVIPVIPGFLLILFAVALFKPGLMKKIREKLNAVFRSR